MKRLAGTKYCGMMLLLLVFLAGCDGMGEPLSAEESSTPAFLQEQPIVYDLMEEKWAVERVDTESSSWNVAKCLEVSLPDVGAADFFYYFSAVEGSCHYVLEDLVTEQDGQFEHTLYWTTTNAASGESVMKQWMLQAALETEKRAAIDSLLEAYGANQAWITGMDVSLGRIFLFFRQRGPEGRETIHYYKVQTNQEGCIESVLDLLPALQENGGIPQDNIQLPGGRCDGTGRCYVGDSALERVSVIDRDGRLLTVLEEPGNSGELKPLTYMGKMEDGRPLYACGDFQGQSLAVLCYDGQEKKELYRGDYELLQNCLVRSDGSLLYGRNGKLLRWNVLSGACETLYDGKNLNFQYCDGMVEGEDGEVYVTLRQEDGTFLYGFTDRAVETVVIRLELLTWGNDYIENCASEYARRHPGVVIEITECQEDVDLQQSRVLAQISQGQGPELMLVRRPQLLALQKEGALAELSNVLPVSDQEQIFPGVLANGKVGDKLYGITYGATFSTLLVSDQVWQGETWTLRDVMGILEEREKEGNPVEQFSGIPYSGGQASHTLYDLALANIGQCSLIDLQAGKCYFDTEEFCSILEFCKKSQEVMQGSASLTEEELAQRVRAGKVLAYKVEGNLMSLSRAFDLLGEGFHEVGYPTDGETGNLLMTYEGCVAVNIHAGHREIVDDFLRCLTDYKFQRQYSTSWMRMDVLRDCVKDQVKLYDFPAPVPVFQMGAQSVAVLKGKADGTSYLDEFLEMAGDSVPYRTELDIIRNIVQEETDACFAGDRNPKETAQIIQSRVQLYLDESG